MSHILTRIFPDISKFSKLQREEYAKLWFDIAKLSVASLILKFFEPGSLHFDVRSIITITTGLTIFWLCVRFGLYVAKERKL